MYIFHREAVIIQVENSTAVTTFSDFDLVGEQPFGPNKAIRLVYSGGFYIDNPQVATNPVCIFTLHGTPTTCSGLQVEKETLFSQEVSLPLEDAYFRMQYDLVHCGEEGFLLSQTCLVGYRSNDEAARNNYDNRIYILSSNSNMDVAATNIQFTAELSTAALDFYVFYHGMYAEYL